MVKKAYILIFLMLQGTFMYPRQFMGTAPQEMSCHTTESKNCCQHEDDAHNNCCNDDMAHSGKSCKDSCTSCHTCSGCITSLLFETTESSLHNPVIQGETSFVYTFPIFSNTTFNIWQPPKLI